MHQTQPTAMHTSYVIAKYVLEENTPTKLGIYAIHTKYLTGFYGTYIYIYVLHIKPL